MPTNKVNNNIKLKSGGGVINDATDGLSVNNDNVFQGVFGDGSDGDVTISSDTPLARDMYYNNLTINNGITLNPKGFRIFVKGTLNCIGTGKIDSNGGNGGNGVDGYTTDRAGGTAGVRDYTTGTLPVPTAGAVGGAAVMDETTQNGLKVDIVKNLSKVYPGAVGGNGGNGVDTNGGTGGATGAVTGTIYSYPFNFKSWYDLYDLLDSTITKFNTSPGAGSGAGGGRQTGSSGGSGGGSGASGGVIFISANVITNLNVDAKGGNGGNGGNGRSGYDTGGGGGGAGGTGGVIIIFYNTKTTVTASVAGGTKGTKGLRGYAGVATDGSDGNNGSDGLVIQIAI